VHFSSLLSGGFTTMAVINPPERKLGKRTSVHWTKEHKITFQQIAKAFSNSVPLDNKLSLTQSEFGIAARYSNYHIFS
jgi:hypothetical protein